MPRLFATFFVFMISPGPAWADLILVEYTGSISGRDIIANLTYDSDSVPDIASSHTTRIELLSFTATVDGVSAAADGTMFLTLSNDGNAGTRDFVEAVANFTGFNSGNGDINTLGFSLFDITDPGTNPDALSAFPMPFTTQAEFDAFPVGFNNGSGTPGGRRAFIREDAVFRVGTLDSLVVTAIPEPSPALFGTLACTYFLVRSGRRVPRLPIDALS